MIDLERSQLLTHNLLRQLNALALAFGRVLEHAVDLTAVREAQFIKALDGKDTQTHTHTHTTHTSRHAHSRIHRTCTTRKCLHCYFCCNNMDAGCHTEKGRRLRARRLDATLCTGSPLCARSVMHLFHMQSPQR